MTISIRKLKLRGFRAYLKEQVFDFPAGPPGKSLAIYAANAKGKSSLVDSIEFFFSEDGTLKRLGTRASGNQAGPSALAHVDAAAGKIDPSVAIGFSTPGGPIEDTRSVGATPLPDAAKTVRQSAKVDFIVRGFELRRFVEDQSPEERYRETSSWFGLSRLPEIQQDIRTLRLDLKKAIEDSGERLARNRDLLQLTDKAIQDWNEATVLGWLNRQVLGPLDPALVLAKLDPKDPGYQTLRERSAAEVLDPAMDAARQALPIAKGIYSRAEPVSQGSLVNLATQALIASEKRRALEEERTKAASAAFQKLWEEAEKLLARREVAVDICPLCETDFPQTPHKSRDGVQRAVAAKLEGLKHYRDALAALNEAVDALSSGIQSLTLSMDTLIRLLETAGSKVESAKLMEFKAKYLAWDKTGPVPDESVLQSLLADITTRLLAQAAMKQGLHSQPSTKALEKVNAILKLKEDYDTIDRYKVELRGNLELIEKCEKVVIEDIRRHTQKVIDGLGKELEIIYRELNAGIGAPPAVGLAIREDTKKPFLELTIDFAPNAKKVAPSGYLSDSQLHALALSLRLSAIKLINQGAPIIVLDDIVTSYDVDHRRALASTLAKHFGSFQFLVVTHDELFHRYLKDVMPGPHWDFQVITELKDKHGPKFSNHRIAEQLIEDKLTLNQDVANDMRQFEEEWLLELCTQFGVDIRIRELAKPFEYDRSELAIALAGFLKNHKMLPPEVAGVTNPFLGSLSTGVIENFGSHFQAGPTAGLSVADQRLRWGEFKAFRSLFRCPKCKKGKFSRPRGARHPMCKAQTCETPFEFAKLPEAPPIPNELPPKPAQ